MARTMDIPFAPPEAYAEYFERYGRSPILAAQQETVDLPGYETADKSELDDAVEHVAAAKKPWAQKIDYHELEFLFNRSRKDWERSESLYIHVQQTVRERFPELNRTMMLTCQAYVAGIMWIFLKRRNMRGRADARKRKAGLPVPRRLRQTTRPVDKKHRPQRMLL